MVPLSSAQCLTPEIRLTSAWGQVRVGDEGTERAVFGVANRDTSRVARVPVEFDCDRSRTGCRLLQHTPRSAGQIASTRDEISVLIKDLNPAVLRSATYTWPWEPPIVMSWGWSNSPGPARGVPMSDDRPSFENSPRVILAVAIRHKDVGHWVQSQFRSVDRRCPVRPPLHLPSQRQQHFPVGLNLNTWCPRTTAIRSLADMPRTSLIFICITRPDVSLRINSKSVKETRTSPAKARQKLAQWIKFQNRRLMTADAGGIAGGFGVETSMKIPRCCPEDRYQP